MTIISILLIGGLVYTALQQKNISIRNTILVITIFLTLCMTRKEGLQVSIPGVAEVPESCTGTPQGTQSGPEVSCDIDQNVQGPARCPPGCTYTAPSPEIPMSSRDFAAGDLVAAFSTCTTGKVVNETQTGCSDSDIDSKWRNCSKNFWDDKYDLNEKKCTSSITTSEEE